MKLSKAMGDAINEQINKELYSSYLYLAMSAFVETLNFRGAAQWLRAQSAEEYMHAMKFYDFVINSGAQAHLKAIAAPPVKFKSLVGVFEEVLEHEQMVSASIEKLYETSMKERCFSAQPMLQWFINEQIEEEQTARGILAKVNMLKNDPASLLALDAELGQRVAAAAPGTASAPAGE
jgi:ferritin